MKNQVFHTAVKIASGNEKGLKQQVSGHIYRYLSQEWKTFFIFFTGIIFLFNSCKSVIVDPSDDQKPTENIISMPLKYDNSQVVPGLKDSTFIIGSIRK